MNGGINVLGLCVSLLIATPAAANATYVGSFKGVLTSGSSITNYPGNLLGQSVDIDFTAIFLDSYVNYNGDMVPNYIRIGSSVSNSTLSFGGSGSNEYSIYAYPFPLYKDASFSGNAGTATISYHDYSFYGDFGTAFNMSYSGASNTPGPVTGSGTASSYYYGSFFGGTDYFQTLNFDLVSGSVFAVGVPEPASWALMICGFGFVGAGLRRRKANLRVSYT